MIAPGYVVREIRTVTPGWSTYTIVDMAGDVMHATVPHHLTETGLVDPVLRQRVAYHHARTRRYA